MRACLRIAPCRRAALLGLARFALPTLQGFHILEIRCGQRILGKTFFACAALILHSQYQSIPPYHRTGQEKRSVRQGFRYLAAPQCNRLSDTFG